MCEETLMLWNWMHAEWFRTQLAQSTHRIQQPRHHGRDDSMDSQAAGRLSLCPAKRPASVVHPTQTTDSEWCSLPTKSDCTAEHLHGGGKGEGRSQGTV